MQTHTRRLVMAIGLVLVCAAIPALAQGPSPSTPPKTLWSLLGIPQIGSKNVPQAAKRRPTLKTTANLKVSATGSLAEANSAQDDSPLTENGAAASDDHEVSPFWSWDSSESNSTDSATKSNATATNRSSRRTAILKRESARGEKNVASTTAKPQPVNPRPLTPHWIPRQVDESALLQLNARERSVRPVAVTVSGELLSDRVPLTVAVARLDGALGLVPSAIHRAVYRPDEGDDEVPTNVSPTREVPVPALISAAQSSPVSLSGSLR
jgi:hypothetical protein